MSTERLACVVNSANDAGGSIFRSEESLCDLIVIHGDRAILQGDGKATLDQVAEVI
jgi:hypothetical protein